MFKDNYKDENVEDEEDNLSTSRDNDWIEAELTLRQAPSQPCPSLTAHQVAITICRSLQWIDYPAQNAGLERCFPFFTYECRKAVTARQGADTLERFVQYGLLSPALQPFMGATRVQLGDLLELDAQPPMRGAMVSVPIAITESSIAVLQHRSGLPRTGIAAERPTTQTVMRLEQQRRPPHQHCWLVKELVDVRYAFAGDMGNAGVAG